MSIASLPSFVNLSAGPIEFRSDSGEVFSFAHVIKIERGTGKDSYVIAITGTSADVLKLKKDAQYHVSFNGKEYGATLEFSGQYGRTVAVTLHTIISDPVFHKNNS